MSVASAERAHDDQQRSMLVGHLWEKLAAAEASSAEVTVEVEHLRGQLAELTRERDLLLEGSGDSENDARVAHLQVRGVTVFALVCTCAGVDSARAGVYLFLSSPWAEVVEYRYVPAR